MKFHCVQPQGEAHTSSVKVSETDEQCARKLLPLAILAILTGCTKRLMSRPVSQSTSRRTPPIQAQDVVFFVSFVFSATPLVPDVLCLLSAMHRCRIIKPTISDVCSI